MNKIIALIGMPGCGKSEAVKFFEKRGYKKVYFGEVVMDEIKRLGLVVNEENEKNTRENLRNEFGMAAMAIKSIDKIDKFYETSNVVIESLYSWEEYKVLKQKYMDNIKLLCIYTTKEIRYKRLIDRPFRPLSRLQAESRDIAEIENLNKGGPIAFTDYTEINDGSLDDLMKQLKKYL